VVSTIGLIGYFLIIGVVLAIEDLKAREKCPFLFCSRREIQAQRCYCFSKLQGR
jgi:hypothetical protein